MAKEAQTGQCSAHQAPVTRITATKDENGYPAGRGDLTTKPRISRTRGLIAMLLGWYLNAYSLAGVTLFLTLVPHGHLLSWPPLWNFRAAGEAE
jgi:hypothetical protein